MGTTWVFNASDPSLLHGFAISQLSRDTRCWGAGPAPGNLTAADVRDRAWAEKRCDLAALAFATVDLDASVQNPASVDLASVAVVGLLRHILPLPINESRAGDLLEWWIESMNRDTDSVAYLDYLTKTCAPQICSAGTRRLDPDISGIGVSKKLKRPWSPGPMPTHVET